MKRYDFKIVKDFIEANKGIISQVSLGMHEDWFWTAETVYEDKKYTRELNDGDEICGIIGSEWATPVMEIDYINSQSKTINCYSEEGVSVEQPSWTKDALGVLSAPAQEARKAIIVEPNREQMIVTDTSLSNYKPNINDSK